MKAVKASHDYHMILNRDQSLSVVARFDRAWVDDIGKYNEEHDNTLETMEDYYYLTDTCLGLITFQGRYYTNIEART